VQTRLGRASTRRASIRRASIGQPGASAGATDSARAWVVAAGAALAAGTGFGISYSFATFFEAMTTEFGSGRGSTAGVFGITLFLFFGVGVVSGPWSDRIGPRPLVASGGALMACGLLATSRVDQVQVGYITYGVGVGVGAGLIVAPAYATVGGWFRRRRALALGVAAAGSGCGTLVLVPTAEALIDAHGWRTAYVILAGVAVGMVGLATVLMQRAPVPPPPPARLHMARVAGTRAFRWLFLSSLLFSVALFTAFAFVVDFAKEDGVDGGAAALLVGVIGASSVVGRVGLTPITVRLGAVRMMQTCLVFQPLAFAVWLVAGGRYGLLFLFSVLLGVAYGGYVALGPEMAAHLFGVVGLGGVVGLMFVSSALGGLVGPPMSGFLADGFDGSTVPIAACIVFSAGALWAALAVPTEPVDLPPLPTVPTSGPEPPEIGTAGAAGAARALPGVNPEG
jgi:MFS family permease